MAGLEVIIGADNSDLNKKIKEAELALKELSQVKLEQIKLGLDTKEINGNIASVKKSLAELKTVSKDSGNAIAGMAPKVANGGNALMQFSRIAQDAPFGIMGIGNNITATVEAFGHLQKETGSAGGALKAMAGSLLGSGGILLAVSLVTTALTVMSQQGLSVGDVFDKLTGSFDESAKAMKDLNADVAKTAGSEISELKALVSVAQDDTKSREDRLIAVKELQDTFPAYFANLSTEKILNGDLTGVVNELSIALKERARASALAGKAGELASKELTIQEGIRDAYKELFSLLKIKSKDQLAFIQKLNSGSEDLGKTIGNIIATSDVGFFDPAKIELNVRRYKNLREELAQVGRELNHVQDLENRSKAVSIKLDFKPEKAKKVKVNITPQVSGIKSEIIPAPLLDVNGIKVFNGQVDKFGNKIKELPGVIKTAMVESKHAFDQGSLKMIETMFEFNKSANDLIKGLITETFTSLGTMIGNSLAGADGGLKDAGKNILGIIGNFMTEFGKLMISTGAGLVAAQIALKSGNGYAMIAGGVALVAIGTAFAASSKKSQQSAGNSLGGGGSVSTGGGYSSPASSSYSGGGGGSFGNGTVVFEISGQSLIGVLSNTLDKNKRLGGNLGL